MTDQTMQFERFLHNNGPVAIVLKQYLRPAEGIGEPIFPPTYPMPTYRGRVHTVRDGEYRVSVELPPFRQGSGEEKSQDVAGYNIDEFKDGTNICEIDSPQSQANRLEPLFETIDGGKLVPQIIIGVGKDNVVNLLAAGHRAADAVVRFSSLASEFDEAFKEVRKGNHLKLARLAPTSILFGVWDSRGTQVKLPRILKSEIRATNVAQLTRSAQFNPAIEFVQLGAVDEALDQGEGDKNPIGAEGMKHVPAPRTAGGIIVHGDIKRVVRINLVALRALRAHNDAGSWDTDATEKLQKYVLVLALVAAMKPLPMNLREGCLLCGVNDKERKTTIKAVQVDGAEDDIDFDAVDVVSLADTVAREFFGDQYDKKDRLDVIFESGVANKFLSLTPEERKKIARGGPITADAIRRFEEKGKDPLKLVSDSIKEAKKSLPKKTSQRNGSPVVSPESFSAVLNQLEALRLDEQIDQPVKDFAAKLQVDITADTDTHATFKALEKLLGEFRRQRKEAETAPEPEESAAPESA
jgi:CRISPR-associated protein Csb1